MRYLKFVCTILYIYGIREILKPVDMLLILLELPDLKHKNLRLFAKEMTLVIKFKTKCVTKWNSTNDMLCGLLPYH